MANSGQEDKKIILNRVQNFLVANEQLKKERNVQQITNYSLPSLKTPKDDSFQFLMDLLGVMRGTNQSVQDVLNSVFGDIDTINNELKSSLKQIIIKTFFCDNNFIIKPEYTDGTNPIEFLVSSIDYFFLLKTNPLDDVSGAYETSSGLNRFLYETLNGSASSTAWQGLINNITFNQTNQTISFRIDTKYVNQPVSVFVNDYVDSLTIIDKDFFKTIFNLSQTPNKELRKRLQFLNKLVNNIKNACSPTLNDVSNNKSESDAILVDLLNNKGKSLSDVLSENISKYGEYDTIGNDFTNKINQILCQPLDTEITNETILNAYNDINNEINLLNSYLNGINNTLNNSYINNPNGNPINEDFGSLSTLNIDFKLNIIEQIPNNICRLFLSPKVIGLFAIMTELRGDEWNESYNSFLSKFTKSLFDIVKNIIGNIYGKIYNMVSESIWGIIESLVIEIVSEKLMAKLSIITSLLNLFDIFNNTSFNVDFSNCRSVLDGLLKITSLSNIL